MSSRRYVLVTLVGVGALVAGLAVGGYLLFVKPPEDVSNPDVGFENRQQQPRRPRGERFLWPLYGYTPARTRYLKASIRPPFRRIWQFDSGELIEFQPVLARGTLFFVNNDAVAFALRAKNGRRRWKRELGSLNAATPAYSRGRLFIVTLSRAVFCLDARTGRVLWRRSLPSRSESSPLVVGRSVIFGSEDGTVYSLRARDGRPQWTHRAAGAVKGAVAYDRGTLFFGDYAGEVTALRVRDGSVVWSTGTAGRSFSRSGRFYATPAVAYGRVYLGNTDGRVYSFSARTGQLAWSRSTGAFVYAGAAVAAAPGTPPTVYVGSYDGNFYALDARSGDSRWVHAAGGRISGAATVIGRVVYFSTLEGNRTTGLDVRTGRPVFRFGAGKFNPVISDGRRLYLTGYGHQYALVPKRRKRARS